MKARGAPVLAPFVAPTISVAATPDNMGIKPLKQKTTRTTSERTKKVRMPVSRRTKKPPTVTGYHWQQEGAGWELRKAVYVEENGVRKRKRPYVAHLSGEAFRQMKERHKGAALNKAIAQWITEHDH
jgi:hypothetical protein